MIRRCVAIHDCPYLSCLWSVTLSSLITHRLWLHCGSERCPSPTHPHPHYPSISPSLYLSLCPSRSVAHRGPWAPSLNACSALLCTCDIGGMCVCVHACMRACACTHMHVHGCCFRPCGASQSFDLGEDSHLQLCCKQQKSHCLLPRCHTILKIWVILDTHTHTHTPHAYYLWFA